MNAETAIARETNTPNHRRERVVYLLGAGATHGSVSVRSGHDQHRLTMRDLAAPIGEGIGEIAQKKYRDHAGILQLVNQLNTPEYNLDFEQLVTFLDESPSAIYRRFSSDLREVFSSVLRDRLSKVEEDLGPSHSELYAALVDMHDVADAGEELAGFLTLNYDGFLEHAIERHLQRRVDYGVAVAAPTSHGKPVRVLKLHGSFSWSERWPMDIQQSSKPGFWIPPGIQKSKIDYPFNAIWGLARDLLDCDVLRIIGCNLSANDWDLVSLLFATRLTHARGTPYRTEVISDRLTAQKIRDTFPYLEALWLPELPRVGEQIIGELLATGPRSWASLSPEDRKRVEDQAVDAIENPFYYWLKQMGETMDASLDSISTPSGLFETFVGR